MNWLSILTGPFSAIAEKIGDYQIKKQEHKENGARRTHELREAKHTAQVDRVKRGDKAEMDYDRVAQENARNSIVDELMIVWVLGIVTLLFIPDYATTAKDGFKALSEVPMWFQFVVLGGFISKLGLRFMFAKSAKFSKILKQ